MAFQPLVSRLVDRVSYAPVFAIVAAMHLVSCVIVVALVPRLSPIEDALDHASVEPVLRVGAFMGNSFCGGMAVGPAVTLGRWLGASARSQWLTRTSSRILRRWRRPCATSGRRCPPSASRCTCTTRAGLANAVAGL